jgi:hypothetical protein
MIDEIKEKPKTHICGRCRRLGREYELPLYRFTKARGKIAVPCTRCRKELYRQNRGKSYAEILNTTLRPDQLHAAYGRVNRLSEAKAYRKEYNQKFARLNMRVVRGF